MNRLRLIKIFQKTNARFFVVGALILVTSSCALKWMDTIRYGSVGRTDFSETIDVDIQNRLIFVPVQINGKTYRFLLDTGAPFSISKEIQTALRYKKISKGHIVDSDFNRQAVEVVQVDSLHIGTLPFLNQTAFIGDFKASPTLNCLHIDGILGSNLIRHCNWVIDMENQKITLTSRLEDWVKEEAKAIPFSADNQFDIMLDMDAGASVITNIKLDYGSNGGISLPENIFDKLEDKSGFEGVMIDRGTKQTGLVGKPVAFERKSVIIDSVGFGSLRLNNIEIKTGKSGLLGTRFLSGFLVSIDWTSKQLYFKKYGMEPDPVSTYGFLLGYTIEKGMYVQSVMDDSDAFHQGITPNMTALKADSLDFNSTHDFCDYIVLMRKAPDTMHVLLQNEEGDILPYKVSKTTLLTQKRY